MVYNYLHRGLTGIITGLSDATKNINLNQDCETFILGSNELRGYEWVMTFL